MPAISHIHSITFSPDGRHIACSGVSIYDRGIILIFEEDQDRLRRIPAPISDFGDYVSQVAFSKDGWLASSCQKGIIIFKEKNGALKQIQELKSQSVFSIAFAPDRRWLVSGTCDGTIQIWANDRGRLKYAYKVKQGTMFGSKYREVAFSPDGRRIASIVDEGKIEIWEYNPGRLKQTQQLMNLSDEFPYSVRMAFSSNGQWLAAINVRLSIVQIWADNSQGRLELVQKLECHIAVSSIAFSANGQWLASGGHSNVVQIWAYKQGKFELAQKLERPGLLELPMNEVTSLAFSPNGQILILGFDGGIIEVWKNDSE
jgi:WD40 repeat protein